MKATFDAELNPVAGKRRKQFPVPCWGPANFSVIAIVIVDCVSPVDIFILVWMLINSSMYTYTYLQTFRDFNILVLNTDNSQSVKLPLLLMYE